MRNYKLFDLGFSPFLGTFVNNWSNVKVLLLLVFSFYMFDK
jgi:hypothetical protein